MRGNFTDSVAVIIVTYNQFAALRKCLVSVLQAMEDIQGSILVVDNASTDRTSKMMANEFPQIHYVQNDSNLYYTRAVNQGLRATQGEYVFILNDDTELTPHAIKQLIDFMVKTPRCGAVGPITTSANGNVHISSQKFPTPLREALGYLGIEYYSRNISWMEPFRRHYPAPMKTQKVDWLCGGILLMRRTAMEKIHYHDEKYLFYRDDPDAGMRLKAAGWELWYNSDVTVVHHEGLSTQKTNRWLLFATLAIRSRRHYYYKFHSVFGVLLVEMADLSAVSLRLFKRLLFFDFERAKKERRTLRAFFDAFRMPPEEKTAIQAYEKASYNGKNPKESLVPITKNGILLLKKKQNQ